MHLRRIEMVYYVCFQGGSFWCEVVVLSFVDRAFTELLEALLSTTCSVKPLGSVKAYASFV